MRAKAAVRVEVMNWGLDDEYVDPEDTLLKLIAQSARRASMYAQELKALVEESPSLHEALVAEIWISTEHDRYKAGEYVRGLAKLEAEERDRLAGFCSKAVAAGLMKKQTELATLQGEMLVKSLQAILDRVSLTDEQKAQVRDALRELPAA